MIKELLANLKKSAEQKFLRFAALYVAVGFLCIGFGFFGYDLASLLPKMVFSEVRYFLGLYPDKPFSEGAIKDTGKLMDAIGNKDDPLARQVWLSLTSHTRELVERKKNTGALTPNEFDEAKHLLIHELNALLGTPHILNEKLYEGLNLPVTFRSAITYAGHLSLTGKIQLSRLLLYAKYPDAINNRHLTRWDYWSISALALTGIFSLLFIYDCYKDTGRPALFDDIATGSEWKISLLFVLAVLSVVGGIVAVVFHAQIVKLFLIAAFFGIWCRIDSIIVSVHPIPRIREEFRSLFWYVDLPFLVGLTTLLLFYLHLKYIQLPPFDPDTDAFFAGAIAFKVILQNTNFLAVMLRSFTLPRTVDT